LVHYVGESRHGDEVSPGNLTGGQNRKSSCGRWPYLAVDGAADRPSSAEDLLCIERQREKRPPCQR
jgi:hypothetical protein